MKRFETHTEAWSHTIANGGFAYATNDCEFAVAMSAADVAHAELLGWKLLGAPPCRGCGADPSDPEDECGCPEDSVSRGSYHVRDMPSWDASR